MSLEGSLEENVLAMLCFSKDHAHDIALEVDTELFSTRAYRMIATKAVEYLSNYSNPAGTHLRDILETEIKKADEGKLISATIQAMEELYPQMNDRFILDQLAFFVRKARMTKNASDYADLVHKGRLDEAEGVLDRDAPTSLFSHGIWAHDDVAMTAFMDNKEEDTFSFGVDEFDRHGFRPTRETLTALLAPAKAGKSWFLVNAGKACLLEGRSVLHISLENSEKLTAKRYIQSLYAMSQQEVGATRIPRFVKNEAGQLTDIVFNDLFVPKFIGPHTRKLIGRQLRKLKTRPRLLIKEFPMGSLTMGQLNTYMDMLARKFNFRPDTLIIDYPDLMAIKGGDKRIEIGNHFVNIRGLCQRRKMAGITVTQVNRVGADVKLVTATHVAEDWSKIATCDAIVTYNRTAQEKKLNLARLFLANARDAEDGYVSLISQSYKTGQFCLDSTFHSSGDDQLIEHMTGEPSGGAAESD